MSEVEPFVHSYINPMHVKKGDNIKILVGKDRGKTGKIIKVLLKKDRVIIEGLNMVKKHIRPKKEGEKGEVVEMAASIHVSNVKRVGAEKITAGKTKKK